MFVSSELDAISPFNENTDACNPQRKLKIFSHSSSLLIVRSTSSAKYFLLKVISADKFSIMAKTNYAALLLLFITWYGFNAG